MRLDFLVYAGSLLWCRKIPLAIQFLVLVIQHFWAGVVVIVRELGLYQLIPSSSVARYKKQEEALEEYPCGSDVKPMKEKSIWVWGGGRGGEEGLRTGYTRCFKINETVAFEVSSVQFQPGSGSLE